MYFPSADNVPECSSCTAKKPQVCLPTQPPCRGLIGVRYRWSRCVPKRPKKIGGLLFPDNFSTSRIRLSRALVENSGSSFSKLSREGGRARRWRSFLWTACGQNLAASGHASNECPNLTSMTAFEDFEHFIESRFVLFCVVGLL